MNPAPALTVLKRIGKRPVPAPRVRAGSTTAWATEPAGSVEITAPDPYCASLLLSFAAPHFPATIVGGTECTVRLQPPAGGTWVLELLSLVERWLESAPLPCAKLTWDGRSYLVRAAPTFDPHPPTAALDDRTAAAPLVAGAGGL